MWSLGFHVDQAVTDVKRGNEGVRRLKQERNASRFAGHRILYNLTYGFRRSESSCIIALALVLLCHSLQRGGSEPTCRALVESANDYTVDSSLADIARSRVICSPRLRGRAGPREEPGRLKRPRDSPNGRYSAIATTLGSPGKLVRDYFPCILPRSVSYHTSERMKEWSVQFILTHLLASYERPTYSNSRALGAGAVGRKDDNKMRG